MKTRKIAKLLGLGLATALAFSLGASLLPVSADVQEWSEVTTPSWEDYVIEPDSDILDYAVGGTDGDTVYAVKAHSINMSSTSDGGGNAEWADSPSHTDGYSIHLETAGTVGTGNEARITLDLPGIATLGDISSRVKSQNSHQNMGEWCHGHRH